MSVPRQRLTLMLTTPGWRGSGVSFTKLVQGLASRGHDVQLIVGSEDVAAEFARRGCEAQWVPTGDTGRREVSAVRRLFAAHRPEAVLCDAPRDVRIARYASIGARRRIIWRYNLHGRKLATDFLQRWLFGGVRAVVHVSRYSADRLISDSPWLARIPAAVIRNGFDPDEFPEDPDSGARYRVRLGIAADSAVILTPTPRLPEKSVEVAEVAAHAVARYRPVTWLVADPGERSTHGDLVILPIGRVSQREIHDAMRAADVVLTPGAQELFGNVTAEAMAIGRPVVAAAGGGIPELVDAAGELFPPGDAATAGRQALDLLENPARRAALGKAGRARIAAEFRLDRMIEAYETILCTGREA